jgi:hypothetical protein
MIISGVMAGLVPAIHDLLAMIDGKKDVDARDKRGHDESSNTGDACIDR